MTLLSAPARVLTDPSARADVSVPLSARVEKVRVREGATVEAGAELVDVVMPEVVRAAGSWLAAGVRLDAATERVRRLENLRADNLARSADIADARTAVAEARAARIEAEAVLRSAGFSGNAAQRLSRGNGVVTLESPIAGIVVEITAVPGARVEPTSGPLVRVVAAGRPRIEARLSTVPPADVGFRFEVSGRSSIPVVLTGRAPVADPNDGTVLAWFEPEGEEDVPLASGTPGVLRIEPGSDVVAVPARAVATREGGTFVLVQGEDGAPRRVDVTVLGTSGAEALVLGELVVGTVVAAEAERLLANGDVP